MAAVGLDHGGQPVHREPEFSTAGHLPCRPANWRSRARRRVPPWSGWARNISTARSASIANGGRRRAKSPSTWTARRRSSTGIMGISRRLICCRGSHGLSPGGRRAVDVTERGPPWRGNARCARWQQRVAGGEHGAARLGVDREPVFGRGSAAIRLASRCPVVTGIRCGIRRTIRRSASDLDPRRTLVVAGWKSGSGRERNGGLRARTDQNRRQRRWRVSAATDPSRTESAHRKAQKADA